ncbi:Alkaline phosphatase, partial [hydrothermal vent metagenome]
LTNTSGTVNLGSSGYVLEIDGTDTPLSNSATFSAGTSTVKYTGTTTATNITTLPYSSVQLTPTAATTYSLTGNLIGANAITGNLSIDTNATLDVTASNFDIDIAGDWSNTGGLTAHSGTVNFNGTNQTVNGSTIFYNLTKSVAAADTLTFAANSTQTIASGGTVTLTGASGQLLTLNCSGCTPGVDHWNLAINGSAFKSIDYVDVSDADASGSDASHTPINPANSNDGGSTISWFGNAMITVMKMSAVITDPVNGGSSPKRIPGAVIEYTVVPSNSGSASPDVNTVVVTDVVDADSVAFDTTTGVSFTDGSTSSGLALGTVTYSSTAAPGPYVYDYTPSAGYDGAVTSIKVTTTGTFNYGGAPDPDFMLRYRVLIK